MIKLSNVSISYTEPIIKDSEIFIPNGKITTIMGESGTGKTSLLYLIGLLGNIQGKVNYEFNGKRLKLTSDYQISKIRKNKIGYVFQENNVLDYLTIYQNFEFICSLTGQMCTEEKVVQILKDVHLNISLDAFTTCLSGGERQRLCIALALAKNPDLIILDEPTSNLDVENSEFIMSLLKQMAHVYNKMILIATHSKMVEEASDICYKILDKKISLIKGDVKEKSPKVDLKKMKSNFFKFYVYNIQRYFHFHFKTYMMICILCAIGINFITGSLEVGKILIHNQKVAFNHEFDNEILIVSRGEAETKYLSFLPEMTNEEVERIYNIEGIQTIYPYIELNTEHIMLDDINHEGIFLIQPYFKENGEGLDNQSVYIDRQLRKEKGTLTFFVDEKPVQLDIGGKLSALTVSRYSNSFGYMIKVPYEKFCDIISPKNQMLVCYVEDYEQLQEIIDEIHSINPNFIVHSDIKQVESYQDMLSQYGKMIFIITVIISVIVEIILFNIYRRLLTNRKNEFSILKSNGLSNMGLYMMLFLESLVLVLAIVLLSCLVFILLACIYPTLSFMNYIFYVLLGTIIVLNIAILSTVRKTLFKSPSYLLRN